MSSAEPLTTEEEELLEKLLSNPLFFPGVFKDWISELTRGQVTAGLPFAEILQSDTLKGTVNFFANIAPTYPAHLTWKDAGTMTIPGPVEALIFFMGSSYNWSGDYGHLALSVNGAAPENAQRISYRGVSVPMLSTSRPRRVQQA